MESKKNARASRGEVSETDILVFKSKGYSPEILGKKISDKEAVNRTLSARVIQQSLSSISKKERYMLVPLLAKQLAEEKALYSRIAISECLGDMGEAAVLPLVELLGRIGKNQETALPEKGFGKDKKQLLRDFAARTLVKVGSPAVPALEKKLKEEKDEYILQQIIDTLGGIADFAGDKRAYPALLDSLKKHRDKPVTCWKIIRAMGRFHEKSIAPEIVEFLDHPEAAIRWETARSLGKCGNKAVVEKLITSLADPNVHVRRLAARALGQLGDKRAIPPLGKIALEDGELMDDAESCRESPCFEAVRGMISIGGPEIRSYLKQVEKKYSFPAISKLVKKTLL